MIKNIFFVCFLLALGCTTTFVSKKGSGIKKELLANLEIKTSEIQLVNVQENSTIPTRGISDFEINGEPFSIKPKGKTRISLAPGIYHIMCHASCVPDIDIFRIQAWSANAFSRLRPLRYRINKKFIRLYVELSAGKTYSLDFTQQAILGIADSNDSLLTVPGAMSTREKYSKSLTSQNGVQPPAMASISGGTFMMGDTLNEGKLYSGNNEKPTRAVSLASYYLGKTEVTFKEYDAFCFATDRDSPPSRGWGRGQRPIINVSWFDAIAYCNWLSTKQGLPPAYNEKGDFINALGKLTKDIQQVKGFRLPTEAEWEYAVREAGKNTRFGNGRMKIGSDDFNFHGIKSDNRNHNEWNFNFRKAMVDGISRYQTLPVGSFTPNALGLFDMSGNVYEWCHDWYGMYTNVAQTNPLGYDDGSHRIIRGGNYNSYLYEMRVSFRESSNPTNKISYIGFRVARSK